MSFFSQYIMLFFLGVGGISLFLILFWISFNRYKSLKLALVRVMIAILFPIIIIYLLEFLGMSLKISTKTTVSSLMSLVICGGFNSENWFK